jgi:hypothetical protein
VYTVCVPNTVRSVPGWLGEAAGERGISMRSSRGFLILGFAFAFGSAPGALAQQHEIGLTLGYLAGPTRSSSLGALELGGGPAFQANYGYRLIGGSRTALYGEVHFLANPLREIESINPSATRDVSTLYVTPGIRFKFLPEASVSPYAVVGGGYGLYEQSLKQIDGEPNPAPRFTHRGVINFGGGVDFKVWRFMGGRWEIRDFYSGNPSFNAPVSSSGQHNIVVGGGFTLKF